MRVAACIVLLCATAIAQAPPASTQPAVRQGKDGRLVYATDANGNRVIDFSNCGYMGGDIEVPSVPVCVVVPQKDGDATTRIQAAIDHVASLPANQRGAVLLQKGRYNVAGAL